VTHGVTMKIVSDVWFTYFTVHA